MAKAIQLDFPARDRPAELRQRLADGQIEHAEAILEFIELLEVLRKHNVMATLRGAVGARENLITYISEAAAKPESVRGMRNLIALSKILGRIDPELLDAIGDSMAALQRDVRTARPPGFLRVARTWWSPPSRRALLAAGLLLGGIGCALEKNWRSRSGAS